MVALREGGSGWTLEDSSPQISELILRPRSHLQHCRFQNSFLFVHSGVIWGGGGLMIHNNLFHKKLMKMMEFSFTSLFSEMCPSSRLEHACICWPHVIFPLDKKPLSTTWISAVIIIKKVKPEALTLCLNSQLSTLAYACWPESGLSFHSAGGRVWQILDEWFFF